MNINHVVFNTFKTTHTHNDSNQGSLTKNRCERGAEYSPLRSIKSAPRIHSQTTSKNKGGRGSEALVYARFQPTPLKTHQVHSLKDYLSWLGEVETRASFVCHETHNYSTGDVKPVFQHPITNIRHLGI